MTPSDELRQLWQSDITSALNHRDLLRDLERRGRSFDRTIRHRDLREAAAGLLITVIYLWFAVRAGNPLDRAADLWLASCGVWIFFYLRRYSQFSRKPAPDRSLAVYRRELLDGYDRQIRLLKAAKYWYVLPLWAGLMFSETAHFVNGLGRAEFLITIALITVLNAGVWWLNEVAAVRYLYRKRRELAARIGEEGESK